MSLATRIADFAGAVGLQLKTTRLLVNGNAANLAALTTTDKTNLVAAINEVKAGAVGGGLTQAQVLTRNLGC